MCPGGRALTPSAGPAILRFMETSDNATEAPDEAPVPTGIAAQDRASPSTTELTDSQSTEGHLALMAWRSVGPRPSYPWPAEYNPPPLA